MRATLFADISKQMPGAASAHVSTALGNQPKRKSGDDKIRAQLFRAIVTEGKELEATNVTGPQMAKRYGSVDELPSTVKDKVSDPTKRRQWMHVFNSALDAHGDESRAFAEAWSAVKKLDPKRSLEPNEVDGTAATPFAYDPQGLARLRPDQVPRFLGAITGETPPPVRRVALDGLTAMQDRVDPEKVEAIASKERSVGKLPPPIVVGLAGRHYIADGHHRLAAAWLNGEDFANVRYLDLQPYSNALKRRGTFGWDVPFEVAKMDAEQQLVFGWASIVTKNGQPVIDHQNDIIPVPELEKAAYDFVLVSREGDDMHETGALSRCIESMVFTKQKQELLKIDLGMEGWWTGFKVDSAPLWSAVKRGERPEFSIGGQAVRAPA